MVGRLTELKISNWHSLYSVLLPNFVTLRVHVESKKKSVSQFRLKCICRGWIHWADEIYAWAQDKNNLFEFKDLF